MFVVPSSFFLASRRASVEDRDQVFVLRDNRARSFPLPSLMAAQMALSVICMMFTSSTSCADIPKNIGMGRFDKVYFAVARAIHVKGHTSLKMRWSR